MTRNQASEFSAAPHTMNAILHREPASRAAARGAQAARLSIFAARQNQSSTASTSARKCGACSASNDALFSLKKLESGSCVSQSHGARCARLFSASGRKRQAGRLCSPGSRFALAKSGSLALGAAQPLCHRRERARVRGKTLVCCRAIKHLLAVILLPALLVAAPLLADDKPKPAPRTPDRTELWVPSEDLQKVLEKNKNAVLLTPGQYEALIRDAGKLKPDDAAAPPPVSAAVERMQLSAKVHDGDGSIRLRGEITARALAQGWSATTVSLPWMSTGKLSASTEALLSAQTSPPQDGTTPAPIARTVVLTMKGPAQHRIEFECAAPIQQGGSPDERVLSFSPTTVPAVLDLELPVGSKITRGPAHETKGAVHRFFLNGVNGSGPVIAWRVPAAAGSLARFSAQRIRGTCRVSGSELTANYEVRLSSSAIDSPAREAAFTVSPANASVIAVEGEKIESWLQIGSALTVKLSNATRTQQLQIELRVPLALPEEESLSVGLPALLIRDAVQVPAIVEMTLEEGVELLELQASRSPLATVAEWDAAGGKATVTIRKVSPRIVVDADARAFVGRDFVEIERTLNAATDVPVDHLHVELPDDEELLEVTWLSGPKLEWKRVAQTVEIDWQAFLNAQTQGKLTIKSRKKLDATAAAQTLSISNVVIDDAKKLAGYIALDHEPGWRVALKETSGLEDRDVRLTPVKGKMAWFNLRDFRLGFEVQRRESVVDAEVTAYALPRAKSVEIEGQIALDITGAPLRQIEVRVTKEQAKLLRFTSPLISEQTLDEATGAWKLTLTRESTGRVNLRFRVSLDGKVGQPAGLPGQPSGLSHLSATLPRFEIPAVRRFHGSWVVEANTDTQLSLATQSLQPIDVMRVPVVEDYTPRHRLVAAFAYGTGAHALTVTAARHANSELAALVVTQLALTSVLSQDGTSKHEALIELRHSGEQFAHVRLPVSAQLLSVIVDGRAVKPVRGENEAIAIPLPGGSANSDHVTARLIYELPGEKWTARGVRKLEPLTLLGNAPILATEWKVRVPDGFSYSKVDTGLEQSGTFESTNLLLGLGIASGLVTESVSVAKKEVDFLPSGSASHAVQQKKRTTVSGRSATELGDYDNAKADYDDVLRRDPTNIAARRGLERVEELRSEYFDAARDETRASMLAKVDGEWETKVPVAGTETSGGTFAARPYLAKKMEGIIFPRVSFSNATVEEAIEFLRIKSRDLDISETAPGRKGLSVILKTGVAPNSARITLDLKDVPMSEALRYITELAGMKYKIEPHAIVVEPILETSSEQFTRIYTVQPDFAGLARDRVAGKQTSVAEKLKSFGIPFPESASATFEPSASKLIVRNTGPNLDLIESFIQGMPGGQSGESFKSGLIPLELDLPASGQLLRFSGTQAPEVLSLRYASWERQMALACGMMAVGGLVFALWGRRRACLRTVLVMLVLSLGVKLFAEAWLPLANAALFGWLVALGIWIVVRVLNWIGRKAAGEIEMRKGVEA